MKTRFWKVQIETCKDGTVNAAVLGSREAIVKPSDDYWKDHWREIFVRWFDVEANAHNAVFVALNKKEGVAA